MKKTMDITSLLMPDVKYSVKDGSDGWCRIKQVFSRVFESPEICSAPIVVIEPTISEIEEVNYCNANADWFINTSITAKEENLSLGYVETRKARNKDENQHDEKIIIL